MLPPLSVSVTIEDRVVMTSAGARTVLVVTPTVPICVGQQRLQELRKRVALSAVDDELVEAARRHTKIHGFIMQGTSPDGRGTWRFDEALSDPETIELAQLVIRGHLPFKRLLFMAGCHDSIYVAWPDREVDIFGRAATGLRQQLQRTVAETAVDSLEGKRARLDRWIVERMTFYQSVTVEHVVEHVLPERIVRREQRKTQVDELLGSVSPRELAGCG